MKNLLILLCLSVALFSCEKDDMNDNLAPIEVIDETAEEVEVVEEELEIYKLEKGIYISKGEKYGLKFFNLEDGTGLFQLFLVEDNVLLEDTEQVEISFFNESFCISNCFHVVEVTNDYLVIEFTNKLTGEFVNQKLIK